MRKPNQGYTQAELDAMLAEYNRLQKTTTIPSRIIAGAVELRQVEGMLKQICAAHNLPYPAPVYGNTYWLEQDQSVYDAIDEQARKPLRSEAIAILKKHGLGC